MNFLEEAKQIARSFDPVTVGKIKRGLMVSLGGAVVAGLGVLTLDISTWAANPMNQLVIHWNVILMTSVGAFCTSVINIIKEWVSGQPKT